MENKDSSAKEEDPYSDLLADLSNMRPSESQRFSFQVQGPVVVGGPLPGGTAGGAQIHFHNHAHAHAQHAPGAGGQRHGLHRLGLRRRHLPGPRNMHFHFRRQDAMGQAGGQAPQSSHPQQQGHNPRFRPNVSVNIPSMNMPSVNMPSVNMPSVNIPNILRRGEGGEEASGGFNFNVRSPISSGGGAKAAAAKQWARERRDAVRHRFHKGTDGTPGSPRESSEQLEEELRETWRRGFLNRPQKKSGQRERDSEKKEAKETLEGESRPAVDDEKKEEGRGSRAFPGDADAAANRVAQAKTQPDSVNAGVAKAGAFNDGVDPQADDPEAQFPSIRRGFLTAAASKKKFLRRERALSSDDTPIKDRTAASGKDLVGEREGKRRGRRGPRGVPGTRFTRSKSPAGSDKRSRLSEGMGSGYKRRQKTRRRNSDNDLLKSIAAESSGKEGFLERLKHHRLEKENRNDTAAKFTTPHKNASMRMPSSADAALASAEERKRGMTPVSPSVAEEQHLSADNLSGANSATEGGMGNESEPSRPSSNRARPPPANVQAKAKTGAKSEGMSSPRQQSSSISPREDAAREEENERWNCPICLGWFDKPVKTPCDHIFCGECLKGVIRSAMFPQPTRPNVVPRPQPPQCPLCREPFQGNQVRPARELFNEMARARVVCPQEGCHERFSPLHCKRHQDTCLMITVQCPHTQFGCSFVGLRKLLPEHLVGCGYEKIKGLFPKIYTQMNQMRGAVHSMEQRLMAQQTVIASHTAILRELYRRSHFNPWHYLQLVYAVFWEPTKWMSQRDRWQSFSLVGAITLLYVLPVYLMGFMVVSYSSGNLFEFMAYNIPLETLRSPPASGGSSSTAGVSILHNAMVPLFPINAEDTTCWAVKPGFTLIVLMLYSLALAVESRDLKRWVGAVSIPNLAWSVEFSKYWFCLATAWVTHALLSLQQQTGSSLTLGGPSGAGAVLHSLDVIILVIWCLVIPFGLEGLVRGQRIKVQHAVVSGFQWGFVLGGSGSGSEDPLTWLGLGEVLLFAFVSSHAAAALGGPKFLQGMETLGMTAEISPTMKLIAGCPNRSLRIASGWLLIAFGSFQVVMQGLLMLKPVLIKELILAVILLLKFGMHTLIQKAIAPLPAHAIQQGNLPIERARLLACSRLAMCMSAASYIGLFIGILQTRTVYLPPGLSV